MYVIYFVAIYLSLVSEGYGFSSLQLETQIILTLVTKLLLYTKE